MIETGMNQRHTTEHRLTNREKKPNKQTNTTLWTWRKCVTMRQILCCFEFDEFGDDANQSQSNGWFYACFARSMWKNTLSIKVSINVDKSLS